MKTKDIVKIILRSTRLLGTANTMLFCIEYLRTLRQNRAFLATHAGYPAPPAGLAYDAFNHLGLEEYHTTGIKEAHGYAGLIQKHLPHDHINFLEWGCGPARIIRHMPDTLKLSKQSFSGTDYNSKTIDWCKKSFPHIHFATNQLQPPLPFESSSTDAILARSVFTHLSEDLHFSWITELLRVLTPGGIIIMTTHGETFTDRLYPSEKQAWEQGDLIIRTDDKEGKKSFVAIHPPRFIREKLLRDSEVVEYLPSCTFSGPKGYEQDVWVVRKR